MKTTLSDMSDFQLQQWYENYAREQAKKSVFSSAVPFHQSKIKHDIWRLYSYGNNIIKVVFIKALANRDKPKKELLNIYDTKPKETEEQKEKRFSQSVSRTKARIFELAMCNEFKYFCTFTQDESKRDRFDLSEFRKDFAMLIRNMNRSRSNENKIKYLLIPEQHKKGAWHMHGLLMGLNSSDLRAFELSETLPDRIRKQLKKGVSVYDWTKYRNKFGFFTCTEISSNVACSKYITKYISKDLVKTARENGEHLFFASQGLKGREVIEHDAYGACPFTNWDFENQYVKVKEFKRNPETMQFDFSS